MSLTLPAARAYIFDIDGTLLNSNDAVHYNAFRKALREIFGIDSDFDGIPVHGNTDVGILRAVVERAGKSAEFESNLKAALGMVRADVKRHRADMQPELCPAIDVLVRSLHSQGKLLGIATGNLASVAWAKLEAAGLRQYFSFGSFSGERELRHEIFAHAIAEARSRLRFAEASNPATSDVCFIGDTPADVLAARANGTPIVAVATGIYSLDELRSYQPDLCLTCCEELFSGFGVS